jgi:hypothetical protein
LPNDVISHPYDPLLLLLVEEDCASQVVTFNEPIGGVGVGAGAEDDHKKSQFDKELLFKVKAGTGMHIAVGNSKSNCGIKDVSMLKKQLLGTITDGLAKCNHIRRK